jgi:small subunit ribosomal protein S15
MRLTSERKKEIITKHGLKQNDTGSPETQVALFTEKINYLTGHLQAVPKDVATQRSLINLVGKRKALLNYLQKKDITRYRKILSDLGIRK